MNTKITISIIIIVIVIFLGFLLLGNKSDTNQESSRNTTNTTQTVKEGETTDSQFDKAPGFLLEDIDGNEVGLGEFPGKILVINSWAVWCPFCVDELAEFGALQEEFRDEIVVIAINRQESKSKSVGFTDGLGLTDKMLYLLDPTDSFYKSIGGFSMPETIFVDANRNIRIHKRGPMELKEMIEKVLGILEQSS